MLEKNNQVLDSYHLSTLFVGSSLLVPSLWVILLSVLSFSFTQSTKGYCFLLEDKVSTKENKQTKAILSPIPALVWNSWEHVLEEPKKKSLGHTSSASVDRSPENKKARERWWTWVQREASPRFVYLQATLVGYRVVVLQPLCNILEQAL